MIRSLYIRKNDETFWGRAEQAAATEGVSLSTWVTRLVRNHFYEVGSADKTQTPADQLRSVEARLTEIRLSLKGSR